LVQEDGGATTEKPVAGVAVGATVLVKSGSRVPLDGEVIQGESSVNQAPITGESIPVDKRAGDPVYAGTINGNGSLQARVTKAAAASTLSRIIKLVEEASEQKSPTQRFVDRFAAIYTPAVVVAAIGVAFIPPLLLGAAWGVWIYRALVLLVKGESLTVVGHRPHDDCPRELLGAISIGDTIRPEASAALERLHRTGIRKIVMLSGAAAIPPSRPRTWP
jgi:cation transport ATPase